MPHSETDIANAALRLIGAKRISALTDTGKEAAVMRDLIYEVRDELLGSANWHFARGRQKLGRLSTTPVAGYDYYYAMPVDWLRTRNVYDNDADQAEVEYHEVSINGVYALETPAEDVYIVYTKEVEDPNLMAPLFRTAWEYALAAAAAPALANSNTKFADLTTVAGQKLSKAIAVDAQSGTPPRRNPGSWVTARMGRPRVNPR